MRLGIRSRLVFASLALIGVSIIAADLYLSSALERLLTARIREDLAARAELVSAQVAAAEAPIEDLARWDALADGLGRRARARVTILDAAGRVIGDSAVALPDLRRLEGHGDRPEVIAAYRGGRGASVRHSATLRRRMMYVATPLRRSGDVVGAVRLAVPLADVERAVGVWHRLEAIAAGLAVALMIIMSAVAAHLASRGVRRLTEVARSMAAGDLTARSRLAGGDEIAVLGQTLDQLAESLSSTLGSLRGERDLLNRILLGMQEGVLVLGSDGRIVLVNGALREMLLLPTDVVGRPLLEAIRDAELQEMLERASDPRSVSPPTEIELAGLKPRRVLVHAVPLRDEAGGSLVVFVDVTELRRLESLRRDFVANVSHEFRTPLAAASSAAETLRSALGDPEATRRFVEMVERNLARLQQLVEDLLDLSRFESREFRFADELVAVAELVERALSLHRERAEEKGIMLSAEVPQEAVVRADRSALEQVIGNLVDNAVKYCPDRGDETALPFAITEDWPTHPSTATGAEKTVIDSRCSSHS